MKKKYISIVMSVYNESTNILEKAIKSIINQTYTNFEFIIILDNPKDDNILAILLKYKKLDNRIILLRNKENIGLANSLNKALEIAKGDYIARMDADDISYLDRIETEKKYLDENNDVDLVSSLAVYIDENDRELNSQYNIFKFYNNNNKINKLLKYANFICHPSWMFRSEILKDFNYSDIKYGEDYEFLLKCVEYKHKIKILDRILLKYRIRSNSMSNGNKQAINRKNLLHIQHSFNKNREIDYEYLKSISEEGNVEMQKFDNALIYQQEAKEKYKNHSIIIYYICILRSMFISKNQFRNMCNNFMIRFYNLR